MLGLTTRYRKICGYPLRPSRTQGFQPADYQRHTEFYDRLKVTLVVAGGLLQVYAIGMGLLGRRWLRYPPSQVLAVMAWEGSYISGVRSEGYLQLWQISLAQQPRTPELRSRDILDGRFTLQAWLLQKVSELPPEQCKAITEPHRIARLLQHVAARGAVEFTKYWRIFGPRATELDLRHPTLAKELTDKQLEEILNNGTSVKQIRLPYSWGVERFARVYSSLPHLTALDFRPVAHLITDEQMAKIIEPRKGKVQSVSLAHCFRAGELTLAALQGCTALRVLDLTDWRGPIPPEGWLEGRQLTDLVLHEWDALDAHQFFLGLGAEVENLELSWGYRGALPHYLARKGAKTKTVYFHGDPPPSERHDRCSFPSRGCDKLTRWHLPLEQVDNLSRFLDRVETARKAHPNSATRPPAPESDLATLEAQYNAGSLTEEEFLLSLRTEDLPKRGLPEVPEWARKSIEFLRLSGRCSEQPGTILSTLCTPLIYLSGLDYSWSGHAPEEVWLAVTTQVRNLKSLSLRQDDSVEPFQLRDHHIDQLFDAHPDLEELILCHGFTMTYTTCDYLVAKLCKLEHLCAQVEGEAESFQPMQFLRFKQLSIAVPTKRLAELDRICPNLDYTPWFQWDEEKTAKEQLHIAQEMVANRPAPSSFTSVIIYIDSPEHLAEAIEVLSRCPQAKKVIIFNSIGLVDSGDFDWIPLVEAIPTSVHTVYVQNVYASMRLLFELRDRCPQITQYEFEDNPLMAGPIFEGIFDAESTVSTLAPRGPTAPAFELPPSIPFRRLPAEDAEQRNPTWRRRQHF
jgi:hypothetical protein